jgi:hypothetical protein
MFRFLDLDERTRGFMVSEIDFDNQRGQIYDSPRLSAKGKADFPALLIRAAKEFDDVWLANELRKERRMNQIETCKRKGKMHTKKVPIDAPEMLAEGEFNRFFARGLCLRAMEDKLNVLMVYRAKDVSSPRMESERLIGTSVSPQKLLSDLRDHLGTNTVLGVPGGPNSGLSVCLATSYSTIC